MKTAPTQPKPESKKRFRVKFKTPAAKRRHRKLLKNTNEVGPSDTLFGGRQLMDRP
jgi:hypothetical protein